MHSILCLIILYPYPPTIGSHLFSPLSWGTSLRLSPADIHIVPHSKGFVNRFFEKNLHKFSNFFCTNCTKLKNARGSGSRLDLPFFGSRVLGSYTEPGVSSLSFPFFGSVGFKGNAARDGQNITQQQKYEFMAINCAFTYLQGSVIFKHFSSNGNRQWLIL